MKKVLFIYNPNSGERKILGYLDRVVEIHQQNGYIVHMIRIDRNLSLKSYFEDLEEKYEYVLIAGGDGTVDNVVNVMKQYKKDFPIGILPVGTANDFAKFIGMTSDIEDDCRKIINSSPKSVDIGKVNDKYFVNVASMGLFTDISQKTDDNLKNTIGKLAYYIKGIEEIPNFRKLDVKISSEIVKFDGYIYLMLIFNGRTAGNLNLAYKASIEDGLLDVVIIRAENMKNIINMFIKLIKREHLEDVEGIMYFKTDKIHIECNEDIVTDIDGERGPNFPLTIECIKNGMKVRGII